MSSFEENAQKLANLAFQRGGHDQIGAQQLAQAALNLMHAADILRIIKQDGPSRTI